MWLAQNYIFRIAPGGGVGDLKQYTGNDVGILNTHIHIIVIIQHNINNGIMYNAGAVSRRSARASSSPSSCYYYYYYYVEHRIFARSDLRIQCPAHHVLFTLAQLAKIIIIIINHQGPSPRRSGCSGRLYNTKRHWHLSSRTRRFRLLRLNVEIPTIHLPRTRTIIIIVTMTNIALTPASSV